MQTLLRKKRNELIARSTQFGDPPMRALVLLPMLVHRVHLLHFFRFAGGGVSSSRRGHFARDRSRVFVYRRSEYRACKRECRNTCERQCRSACERQCRDTRKPERRNACSIVGSSRSVDFARHVGARRVPSYTSVHDRPGERYESVAESEISAPGSIARHGNIARYVRNGDCVTETNDLEA